MSAGCESGKLGEAGLVLKVRLYKLGNVLGADDSRNFRKLNIFV